MTRAGFCVGAAASLWLRGCMPDHVSVQALYRDHPRCQAPDPRRLKPPLPIHPAKEKP